MYIPLTYWESQADTLAQTNAKFCVFGAFTTVPQTISYNYETNPFSYTFTVKDVITNICQDTTNQDVFYRALSLPPGYSGLMTLASQPYFCSATITSSAGIPSTCCVNTPPNTGPEAWYIDIKYVGSDNGTFYFYYVNQYGDLVNDTITFAQGTKRIVSQTAAFWIKNIETGYTNFLNWNLISKFPGQVIPYKYKDIPAIYTFTLKRTSPGGNFTYFNNFNYQTIESSGLNGAQILASGTSVVGATKVVTSYNIPLANSTIYYNPPSCEVSVAPQPKTAFQLVSCLTTHSLWTTLNNYDFYTTGSVLKVTNTQLTSTSSCWTVNNLTSSLSVSVSLTDVNVTQSYSAGFCTNCLGFTSEVIATGGTTGSFLSGSTLYRYNSFTTDGTFSIVSGSITNGKLMVIAGGGGGGQEAGAGAGGLIYSSSVSMANATSYNITIGQGGAPYNGTLWNQNAADGTNSIFSGSGYNVIAIGGGKGGSLNGACQGSNGGNGGSGGGGNCGGSPGSGTSGQGNDGGAFGTSFNDSGGGGGAGSAGQKRFGGAGRELGSVMLNVSASYSFGGDTFNGSATSTSGSGGKGGSGTFAGQTGRPGLVVITYPAFS
jgi:hypothetical protein